MEHPGTRGERLRAHPSVTDVGVRQVQQRERRSVRQGAGQGLDASGPDGIALQVQLGERVEPGDGTREELRMGGSDPGPRPAPPPTHCRRKVLQVVSSQTQPLQSLAVIEHLGVSA